MVQIQLGSVGVAFTVLTAQPDNTIPTSSSTPNFIVLI